MFFKGAQRKVNRLKKDIFTEKGANRNHLAREIYDFINAHGGLCSIKITLTEDRTIEETYKHYYFGDGSVFPLRNDRSASYVSVWDRNNREHRFNFNEHGYMNPDAECVYDLIMRLKDLLYTSHFNFYGQWEAPGYGYSITDAISSATGHYGTTAESGNGWFIMGSAFILDDANWQRYMKDVERARQKADPQKNLKKI